MDLTKEEYERLIELQAVALGCAERSLATLREAHEEQKKALEEERKLTRDLRRQIVAYVHGSSNEAQEERA